jgi:leader peptidase (prepilin peptidase)/N-methyltransferase
MDSFDLGLLLFRIVVLLLGASIGSFLAAAAWRIPRGVSLLTPSSCPSCKATLPWYGLVPIVGVLLVGSKCTNCGERVSWHYAITELLCAVLTLLTFEIHGGSAHIFATTLALGGWSGETSPIGSLKYQFVGGLFVSLWLLYTGLLLSLIDLEFRILPDVVTYPGIVLGLLISLVHPEGSFIKGAVGVVAGAGSLWLIATIYRRLRNRDGLGFGDVKYLAMIGAVLGWSGVLWTLMTASIVGSVVGLAAGLAVFVRSRVASSAARSGSDSAVETPAPESLGSALTVAIPFGPFLAAGAFVYSLFEKYFLDFMMPK